MFNFNLHSLTKSLPIGGGSSDGELMHPYRDWALLLCVCVVVAIGLLSWGGYAFWQIRIGEFTDPATDRVTANRTIDRALLTETLERYRMRALEFEQLNDDVPLPENPAL